MVDVDSKAKVTSSDTSYEAITQQITNLMSTIANQNTNQNTSNNGQMVQTKIMGMVNFLVQRTKGQRNIRKICAVGVWRNWTWVERMLYT